MHRPYPGQSLRTAAFTALLDALVRTPVEEMTLEQIQRARSQVFPARAPFTWITGPVLASVAITSGTARARDGYEIPLRLYRPRRVPDGDHSPPLLVFFHGGGFVQGSPLGYDPLCTHLAEHVGAVVVSVDYRMAPEHRAPRAALDCIDATVWVTERAAQLHVDAERTGVVGDSAGGNLAAVVAQAFRDEGRTSIRHQALIYPGTDMTMSSPSISQHAHAPVLTRANIAAYRSLYLDSETSDTDPLVSPLFGNLDDLPATLVQTGDLDPLRDDGLRYARRLEAAGVRVRATTYLGAPHGFLSFPGAVPCARQARAELTGEIRRHVLGGVVDDGVDPERPARQHHRAG